MRIKIGPLVAALVLSFTTCLAPWSSVGSYAKDDESTQAAVNTPEVAAEGVSIEGRSIAGMTVSEAKNVINQIVHSYDETVFTLVVDSDEMQAKGSDLSIIPVNDNIAEISVNYGKNGNIIERFVANSDIEAGKTKDYSLSLTSDWNKTKAFLEENTAHLESAPVNNTIRREAGGFIFVEGKPGVIIDAETSATKISEFITADWKGSDARIELETMMQEPKGSREELQQINDLLGACSTDFSSSSKARAANVKNGTSKLNGKLIFPGEEFSTSNNLESRNAANGYLPAPSYENGTTVDTYGGGVCQISSTLYNAVIRSELEVVQRHPHSMVVSYVKPSMDAAISEGAKDFVFKNNLNYPVYIEGYTSGGMLYFNIFGKDERPAGRKVTYESEVISTTDPGEKFIPDPALPVGTVSRQQGSHTGYTARLWKVVTENGTETSRQVFNNSSYRASAAIYSVGTASEVPGAKEAIAAAIATQDKENIKAVAESWAGGTPPTETEGGDNQTAAGEGTSGESGNSSNSGSSSNSGNSSNSGSGSTSTGTTVTPAPAPSPDPAPIPDPAPVPEPEYYSQEEGQ